jgi:hypothetical protein
MKNVFTHRDLLTLELLSEAYNEAVKKYKRAIAKSSKSDLCVMKARDLNIAYGICGFAYYMDIETRIEKLKFLDVLRRTMSAMNYNVSKYVYYTVEDCKTKTSAKICLDYRKKLLRQMVQYVKIRIYEERK